MWPLWACLELTGLPAANSDILRKILVLYFDNVRLSQYTGGQDLVSTHGVMPRQ
jgi:hypothetical protein